MYTLAFLGGTLPPRSSDDMNVPIQDRRGSVTSVRRPSADPGADRVSATDRPGVGPADLDSQVAEDHAVRVAL